MKVIPPDFDRTLDLPGLGPTPCPVDAGQAETGFADLLSLRIHDFDAGIEVDIEAGADEVLLALLAGAVTVEVAGAVEAAFTLQADGDWALYLPPRHSCRLTPIAQGTIAFARARPLQSGVPRAFAPIGGVLAVEEGPSRLRLRLLPLVGETDASAGLDVELERLAHLTGPAVVAGEALPPAHTLALSPGEAAHVTGDGEVLTVAALREPALSP